MLCVAFVLDTGEIWLIRPLMKQKYTLEVNISSIEVLALYVKSVLGERFYNDNLDHSLWYHEMDQGI